MGRVLCLPPLLLLLMSICTLSPVPGLTHGGFKLSMEWKAYTFFVEMHLIVLESIISDPISFTVCIPVAPSEITLLSPIQIPVYAIPIAFSWNVGNTGINCSNPISMNYTMFIGFCKRKISIHMTGNSTDYFTVAGTSSTTSAKFNTTFSAGTLFWKVLASNGERSAFSSVGQFNWLNCSNSSAPVCFIV